ncbi:MAG: hypothetical protein LBO68_01720 [Synergistaceae bacterium]|nr:hypothetical protein [Synergistaceae bacterium]
MKKTVYYTITLALGLGVIKAYLVWLDSYNMLHPDVVQAIAMGYVEELPLEGILIWDEEVVAAPREGVLTYPFPLPRRVAKGEAMAAVDGVKIKARTTGYFFPALDGQEGKWVYSQLWPDASRWPFKEVKLLENGSRLSKGDPVGKLVPQPQDLRCIAYLDKTLSLERNMKRGVIDIKTEPYGKSRQAVVRASDSVGQKVKVYLTLPFFPPEILTSRFFSCSVVAGDRHGVSLPESAVVMREGKLGVFMVQGSMTEFIEVEGFPTEEGSFFITKGVMPGNWVVLYANKAKEGAIRLW